MSGTKAGGQAAKAKNLARDPDFYAKIGAKGGQNGHTGGFAAGEEGKERARKYGAIGGRISRRVSEKNEKSKKKLPGVPEETAWEKEARIQRVRLSQQHNPTEPIAKQITA